MIASLRCRNAVGELVELPFVDGRYAVPSGEQLVFADPLPELHGPVLIEAGGWLQTDPPGGNVRLLFDGYPVILRWYLGDPTDPADPSGHQIVQTCQGQPRRGVQCFPLAVTVVP